MNFKNLIENQYGSPATVPQDIISNSIVVNQQNPPGIIPPNMFKTNPIALNCLFCHKPVLTIVIKECNCCACFLCFFSCFFLYIFIQCCRGKDLCCYDARHICPNCGNLLGTYEAC